MKKAIFIVILSLILVPSFLSAQNTVVPTTVTTTTTTTSCLQLTYNMGPGSQDYYTSGQVTLLQNFLVSNGYGSFPGRATYGPLTFQAVQNFQQRNGISPVGLVGPVTRAKIASITCGTTTQGVSISSISPTAGPIYTQVTLSGSGFSISPIQPALYNVYSTPTTLNYNNIVYLDNFPALTAYSSDGQTLVFNIPRILPLTPGIQILPGPLMVKVSNSNGTSNTVNFNVTDSSNTQSPNISSLTPSSGPIGTQVAIYGSGFTQDNRIRFGSGGAVHVPSSNNGTLLYFTIPSSVGPCDWVGDTSPIRCLAASQQVVPGTYPMSVENTNGSSNSLNFTVTSSNTSYNPVINGVNAPTQLNVNQTGTWTVSASDPQNGNLSYSVDWGDNNQCPYGYTCSPSSGSASANSSFQQSTTFTHSYSQSGTYTQTFIVRNNSGGEARTTTTVQVVGNSTTQSLYLSYLSPQSGRIGTQVTIYGSGFTGNNRVHFGSGDVGVIASSNGTSLTFIVPQYQSPYCPPGNACPQYAIYTQPGTYPVSVINENGTSNSLYFNVNSY